MAIKIDFTGVQTETVEAIPPGRYPARVIDIKHEVAKSSGKPMLVFEWQLTEGEQAERRAWRNYSLQPQALWGLKRTLIALGVPPEDLEGEIEFDTTDIMGADCTLVIDNELYEGTPRTRVNRVLPAGAVEEEGISADELPFE